MTTLALLGTAYADIMRIRFSNISTADLNKLQTLAQQVDSSAITLTAARVEIGKMALATTSVANLSYAFFAGVTPKAGGLDFLVSPTGPNPANLNSTYYAAFSAENRYINFSVALGKGGEGAARFATNYGALDLTAAATKAYTEIFGFAPADGKIAEILNAQVPNGQGGVYTRANYFAAYGGDGPNGQGTKAAMVGWLLSEAAKADLGVYAKANDALLADIANDGQASFNVDLLSVYGVQPTYATGSTIPVLSYQSVTYNASDPTLRATVNNDTITGTDSSSSQVIAGGEGNDTITFTGVVGGYIDGGEGNDTITVGQLNAAVPILGGLPNGMISGGSGNDLITVGKAINGSIIDGGAGDDTLIIGAQDNSNFSQTKITNIEHLVLKDFKLSFNGDALGFYATDYTGLRDITQRSSDSLKIFDIDQSVALKMEGVTGGTLTANYHQDLIIVGPTSSRSGAPVVHAYLSGVTSSSANPTKLLVTGNDGPLILHVQTDSVLDMIRTQRDSSFGGGDTTPVIIQGAGRLTAGIDAANLDATAAAKGVTLTRIGQINTLIDQAFVLSAESDQVTADLRGWSKQTYTLGAGSDTLSIYQDGISAPRFSNMLLQDGKIAAFATVLDFAKGVDHVNLGVEIPSVLTGLSAGAATTLEQALINITTQVAANATAIFEYAGSTYIYHQDVTVGVSSGDGLIKLTGVTGLTVGTGAANVDIHYG